MMALVLALAALWPRKRSSRTPNETRTTIALYGAIAAAALILSMGAQPTAWGWPLPIGAPYRWLFAHLPGFNGLRVPARFSTVVILAIGVLASVGFARLSERWPWRTRLAAATAALLFVVLEGTGGAMPLAFLKPHGRPDRAAYAWVRDAGPGAVLELPAGELDSGRRTYQYEYQSLFHGHPIVNGASGYNSALHVFLGSAASPIVEPSYFGDALRLLREIGVRTVVVRPTAFDDPDTGASIVERFRSHLSDASSDDGQVTSEAIFPGVTIYRLAEWTGNPVAVQDAGASAPAISTEHFVATASHAADRLSRAFDGDIDTRWVSGERQSGGEWIDIAFDHPRDVARLRILTGERSIGDYPRELVVETVAADGVARVLYRGPVVRQLAHGLIAEPRRGPIDIPLPPNAGAHLRIRQAGQTRIWFWSIDELAFFER